MECWKAIHPPSAPQKAARVKTRNQRVSPNPSDSSITSADVPLSTKKKVKKKARPAEDVEPVVPLDKRFYNMIRDDEALWLRMLRYEVSKPLLVRMRELNSSRYLLTN